MKLHVLSELKALVKAMNSGKEKEMFEVWFPMMYRDGEWSCEIVGDSVLDCYYANKIFRVLWDNQALYFIHEFKGCIAIHVQ